MREYRVKDIITKKREEITKMNNLETSINYEYRPFGKELAEIAKFVMPLTEKGVLKPHEYDCLVRSLWVVNHLSTKKSHSKLDGGCSVSTDATLADSAGRCGKKR